MRPRLVTQAQECLVLIWDCPVPTSHLSPAFPTFPYLADLARAQVTASISKLLSALITELGGKRQHRQEAQAIRSVCPGSVCSLKRPTVFARRGAPRLCPRSWAHSYTLQESREMAESADPASPAPAPDDAAHHTQCR